MFHVLPENLRTREHRIKHAGIETIIPVWVGYAATFFLEIILTFILYRLMPYFPLGQYPIVYVIAIMFIAYMFGEGPAILAFVMGIFLHDYFFISPLYTLWPSGIDLTSTVAFLLGTSIVGFATLQMRNSGNNIRALLIQVEDELSERVNAEQALIQSEKSYKQLAESSQLERNQMEAVINSMSQGVLILDPQGLIVNMNPSAMKLFRISRLNEKNNKIEYLSRKFGTFLLDGSPALSVEEYLKKVLDNEKIDDLILHIENRITGNSWIGSINTSAVLDKSGNTALIVLIISDITERVANEQKERELEKHKLEFYQKTILAATNGKLVITDGPNIKTIAGKPTDSWLIDSPKSITDIRHYVTNLAKLNNMDENRIGKFIIAVGEVSANVYKHASFGKASIHITPFSMIYLVSDKGSGIDALNLPDVALRDHFSTAGTLGMGYKVMLSFCDKVYLSTSPNGTTVAIEMRYKDQGNIIGNEMCNYEVIH